MNIKQKSVLQTITSKEWLSWKTCKHIDGELSYNITDLGNKVMLQATNTGSSEWWHKNTCILVFVGLRGGITFKCY